MLKNIKQWHFRRHPLMKADDSEVVLRCAECGQAAGNFVRKQEGGSFEYRGNTWPSFFGPEKMQEIVRLVRERRLAELDRWLKAEAHLDYGLDTFCPECSAFYCGQCYLHSPEYEDGYYDCTYGTCPRQHRRKLDD